MCQHCYKVNYPGYKANEACDLALAQRRKFDDDVAIAEGKPTLKTTTLGDALSKHLKNVPLKK